MLRDLFLDFKSDILISNLSATAAMMVAILKIPVCIADEIPATPFWSSLN